MHVVPEDTGLVFDGWLRAHPPGKSKLFSPFIKGHLRTAASASQVEVYLKIDVENLVGSIREKIKAYLSKSLGNSNPRQLKSSSNVLVMIGNLRRPRRPKWKTLPNDDSPASEASQLTPLSFSLSNLVK